MNKKLQSGHVICQRWDEIIIPNNRADDQHRIAQSRKYHDVSGNRALAIVPKHAADWWHREI